MNTQTSAHALVLDDDAGEVLAFCSCGWGYASPDVAAARDAYASHLREVAA